VTCGPVAASARAGGSRANVAMVPAVSLWIAEAPPGSDVLGAYGRLEGRGQSDALLSAALDGVREVRLHAMTRGPSGGGLMQPLARLAVPARGAVDLKPEGVHLMLIGLGRTFAAGQTLKMRLTFARAGVVVVKVPVRRRD